MLTRYKNHTDTLIFHAAPQDVDSYIAELYSILGERHACLVREITKIHEESIPFLLSEGVQGEKRGEYVLLVEGAPEEECALNRLSPREHVVYYMEQGLDKKDALKRAAQDRGVSKSELYKEVLDL